MLSGRCFEVFGFFLQIVLKLVKEVVLYKCYLAGHSILFLFLSLINYCVYKLIGGIYVSIYKANKSSFKFEVFQIKFLSITIFSNLHIVW